MPPPPAPMISGRKASVRSSKRPAIEVDDAGWPARGSSGHVAGEAVAGIVDEVADDEAAVGQRRPTRSAAPGSSRSTGSAQDRAAAVAAMIGGDGGEPIRPSGPPARGPRPRAARIRAISSPMPPEAPVTSATGRGGSILGIGRDRSRRGRCRARAAIRRRIVVPIGLGHADDLGDAPDEIVLELVQRCRRRRRSPTSSRRCAAGHRRCRRA